MLIEFTVKNYRSFRDEATLSMEATGASTLKSVLIPYGGMRILPGAAIYGNRRSSPCPRSPERAGRA